MDYYYIGQKIRKTRKARGLSQEQLAEKIGISTTHMSHIETGNTKLSLPVFVNLAKVLEVRTDELIYDVKPIPRNIYIENIVNMLDDCSTLQIQIIEDIVKVSKNSLDKYLDYLFLDITYHHMNNI